MIRIWDQNNFDVVDGTNAIDNIHGNNGVHI